MASAGEQRQDVRLGAGATEIDQTAAGPNQDQCDEQHETDAAAAAAQPGAWRGRAHAVVEQLLLRHGSACRLRPPHPECLSA